MQENNKQALAEKHLITTIILTFTLYYCLCHASTFTKRSQCLSSGQCCCCGEGHGAHPQFAVTLLLILQFYMQHTQVWS